MNRIIFSIFAITACFALGHALECYECKIGFWDLCITTKTTCSAGEFCYTGVGKAVKFVDIRMKGCLKKDECNQTTSTNFPNDSNTTVYKITKTCCDSDLCNAAPGLPHVGILPLVLGTLLTIITAKALV